MRWLLLVLVACGSPRRGLPMSDALTLQGEAERGRRVFLDNCQACHPGGEGGVGPALNNKPFPAFLIDVQVRHGLGGMPAFSRAEITDHQLDDLVVYLRQLRRAD